MEYERIHKVQSGMISPSKLRIKLIGSQNQKKVDGSSYSPSRTSPSRLEDSEFVNNSLLAAQNGDFGEEDLKPVNGSLLQAKEVVQRENADTNRNRKPVAVSKIDSSNSSSSVHPVRSNEDENIDYDSTSSFEFQKGDRPLHPHSLTRSLSRPMSSKWDDAEKWIVNKQNMQSNTISKNVNFQNQKNRQLAMNKPSVKRVDLCEPASETGLGKIRVTSSCAAAAPISTEVNDLRDESKDLVEVGDIDLACTKIVTEENTSVSTAIRSVSMRDMGTEMTPIPSQEPSRSVTPVSSTTPLRSPTSSEPSTPRVGEKGPTSSSHFATQHLPENGKTELSEEELKLKTRNEIIALGVQLGKINIAAAWASNDEKVRHNSHSRNETIDEDELENIERSERAAAWEEAEKCKHAARFKREDIRIQAWESKQQAKLEAEMRKIEAQIEEMKAQAQAKMIKKIALARQKSEEKRARAEARKNRQAEKTTARAEYIRQTGRISSCSFMCCGLW